MTDKTKEMIKRECRTYYWAIKLTFIFLTIILIYKTVPNLLDLLSNFTYLIKTSEITPEFHLILLLLGIHIWCKIISVFLKILERLEDTLDKWLK